MSKVTRDKLAVVPPAALVKRLDSVRADLMESQSDVSRLQIRDQVRTLEVLAGVLGARDIQTEASILVQLAERMVHKANPPKPPKERSPGRSGNTVSPEHGILEPSILRHIRQAHADVDDDEFEKIADKARATQQPVTRADLKAVTRAKRIVEDEKRILSVSPVVGKFKTLVIDPPWDHEGFSLAGRGRPEYATMTHKELLTMDIAGWADDACHLYLWTTNNFILRAGALIEAWGFNYKTCLTWVKPRIGLGSYFRSSTEHVLFAVKGKMSTRVANVATHFEAPTGKHSAKPGEFYDMVKRASYPPYGEVFQRDARDEFRNLFDGHV